MGSVFSLSQIQTILNNHTSKDTLQDGRNLIVKHKLDNGEEVVIKSYKKPNLINQVVYKFFRKSKAKRSFEYATILLEKGIGTPKPLAYFEEFSAFGLTHSYYVCDYQPYDLTYRELVEIPDYPDHENILREFTQFCFQLHEKGVEFKDHSPGNTLIKKDGGRYKFYLVDLNRMRFHEKMDCNQRMHNLRRLTPKKEMIAIMADEYAQLYHKPKEKVFNAMWSATEDFQKKYHRRQNLKKKLKRD